MDANERALFEQAVLHATETHRGPALDAALDELGWRDALTADRRAAVGVVFECQGAANTTSAALDDVLRAALGLRADGGALVLPPLGEWDPPGGMEAGCCVLGLGLQGLAASDTVTVVCEADEADDQLIAVTVAKAALTLRPIIGMDPELGLVAVAGEAFDLTDRRLLAPGAWNAAVDDARLALAHELIGATGAMLELARTHALDRVQFGRPIATFQAVRHRLADTLVALEGARALLDAAWADGSTDTAAMAKATAGRAARGAARHCQQVLAGIGFTTEHPLHRHVRRVLVLDEMFGSARVLTRDLGRHLASGEPLPPPIAL